MAVVGYDGADLLDIACITSTLFMANRLSGEVLYGVEVVTPAGRPLRCDSGLVVGSDGSLQQVTGPLDTVIVSGGLGHVRAAGEPTIVAHVKRLAAVSRRVASVCTGASVLAAAGLLDGKRALAPTPEADACTAPVCIERGAVVTTAVTSVIDLILTWLHDDHGPGLARRAARALVVHLHRPGAPRPPSPVLSTGSRATTVQELLDHVRTHLTATLDVPALARRVGLSERQLHRLFVEETGLSPARVVRQLRLAAAEQMLAHDSRSVAGVARACGFTSAETFRQAFARAYGTSPSGYRRIGDPPTTGAGELAANSIRQVLGAAR